MSENKDFVDGNVIVDVKIIKATDLQCEGKDPDKINPYVILNLGSDQTQKHKTKVLQHNPNPEWNETFSFKVKDLEHEVISVDMKSKGKRQNRPIMKRVKISFVSFKYGEVKEVEKVLHWKDVETGKLYLQISLRDRPEKKNTKAKQKDSGICFKVDSIEGSNLEEGNYRVQLKMDVDDNSNPVTDVKQGKNPAWDDELFIKTNQPAKDNLKVILLKDEKRCIDPISINTSEYSVGQNPIVWDDDVFKKKKKVGHMKFRITPLDYNTETKPTEKYDLYVKLIDCEGYSKNDEPLECDLQINANTLATSSKAKKFKWNENFMLPFNSLTKDAFTLKPPKGDAICILLNQLELNTLSEYHEEVPGMDDCYINFTLQPIEHGKGVIKKRSTSVGEKCRNFSFGEYSSEFSTSFTSLSSSFQQSVSSMTEDEDDHHAHKELELYDEEKPCRYDSVSGSLKSLTDLVDIGSSKSKLYVTLDVFTIANKKKIQTIQSNKVAQAEIPELSFEFPKLKKGNKLVLNIWKTVSGADPANIGVIEIPVKDIPTNKSKKVVYDIKEPANFSYGEHDSFGQAEIQIKHDVEYRLPYDDN